MIFNMTGGGAGLNFKVVAYETAELLLADTPKENTIGVVTDADFTNWVFSATEPDEPVDNMLWFILGHGGVCEVDTLKKDDRILLHPIGAMLYTNGQFERLNAYLYQNEWVKFSFKRITLFSNGDQATDITGGWSNVDYILDGYANAKNTKVTVGDTILCSAVSGKTNNYGGICGTGNLINFEGFTKMVVKGESDNLNQYSIMYVGVHDSKTLGTPLASINITANGSFEKELPLSTIDVKELYFFVLAATYKNTTETYTSKLYVSEIYIE